MIRRAAEKEAASLSRRFGDALRAGAGADADRVIDEALASGLAPEAVQALVIQPAMVMIGDLWASQHLTVADEHLATTVSQRALIRVFQAQLAGRPRQREVGPILLAGIEGQHHVLGLRMIADTLEGAGFSVDYLGGDVPVESLAEFAKQHEPSVVGLGLSMGGDISRLADALCQIHDAAPAARIMLGGRAVPAGFIEAGYPQVRDSMEVEATVVDLLDGPPQSPPATVRALCSRPGAASRPSAGYGASDSAAALAAAADEVVDLARGHARRAEKYRDLAFRDQLTGLPNRRALEDELIEQADRPDDAGVLLMVDVDSFKEVNDEQGHGAGDELLRWVGDSIAENLRPSDFGARFGGDEFVVLLPGASIGQGLEIGNRIRTVIAEHAVPATTVSIGAAEITNDVRRTMLDADAALYEAKAAGRNRVVAAGPALRSSPESGDPLSR